MLESAKGVCGSQFCEIFRVRENRGPHRDPDKLASLVLTRERGLRNDDGNDGGGTPFPLVSSDPTVMETLYHDEKRTFGSLFAESLVTLLLQFHMANKISPEDLRPRRNRGLTRARFPKTPLKELPQTTPYRRHCQI